MAESGRRKYVPVGSGPASLRATVSETTLAIHWLHCVARINREEALRHTWGLSFNLNPGALEQLLQWTKVLFVALPPRDRTVVKRLPNLY